ncbi:MAG TPA: PAS domain-containing sensor histidine kinase, partial [Sphingobacteriaceae bacterium]
HNKILDFECLASNYASANVLKDNGAGIKSLKHDAPHLLAEGFLEKFIRVIEYDKPLNTEFKIVTGEGTEWYQLVAVKMLDGLVITYTNISDKKAYDLKLKKNYNELILVKENLRKLNDQLEATVEERTKELSVSEERFRMVSQAINDVIWDWNLVNNTVWWNDTYYNKFGYAPSEGINAASMWLEHIHPDDRDRVEKSIHDTINSGESNWNEEYRFLRADGTYADVLDRGQVMRNENDMPYRMLGSMLDVTELRQAERKLMASEAKFRRIFESSMLGMLFTDYSGKILSANQYFLNLIGYSREDLEAGIINWQDLTPPEYQEISNWAVGQLKETGICPTFEKEYIRKDGKRVWVLVGSAVVEGDEQVNAVSYIIDITDKKEAEAKEESLRKVIKKQQDEFKSIFMDAPALVVIRRGPELTIDFYNKAVVDFFKSDNFKGKSTAELMQLYKSSVTEDTVHKVFETGEPFIGKAFHLQYDRYGTGEVTDGWFDFVHQPVYDDQGNIDGVATFGFDVTDMVLANLELQESQHKLRFLADSIPNKVWTALPDGSIDYINKVMLDYTGKTLQEFQENGWKEIVHPDDWEMFSEMWQHAIETGESLEMERRLKSARGEYRWHLTRSIPQTASHGYISMWVSSSTDIHDQKTLVEEIKASEVYFRQLADKSPFMIWKLDVNGQCNYVNTPWVEFTGLSFDDSMGNGWAEAFHPEDRVREFDKFVEAFKKRESYASKFRIKKADGEYRWVLAQSNPLINDTFQGYIGSLTDITDQELAQQSLKILMQKKDEFMSIASHELKTPITSVKASLQLVQRMAEKQKQAGDVHVFIDRANRQVKKLSDLVDDLLDVTKIHAGKMMFNESEFSIGEAIEDCVVQLHDMKRTHQIQVEGDTAIRVFADKHRIEQVITNFLSNAIKYSPGADKVVLTVRSDQQSLWVEIRDFGIGIPGDKVDYVFDRFFRVQESSQKFSGLGLGLFISAEIIRRHGGDIGVHSEEGQGSVFWFRLNRILD